MQGLRQRRIWALNIEETANIDELLQSELPLTRVSFLYTSETGNKAKLLEAIRRNVWQREGVPNEDVGPVLLKRIPRRCWYNPHKSKYALL